MTLSIHILSDTVTPTCMLTNYTLPLTNMICFTSASSQTRNFHETCLIWRQNLMKKPPLCVICKHNFSFISSQVLSHQGTLYRIHIYNFDTPKTRHPPYVCTLLDYSLLCLITHTPQRELPGRKKITLGWLLCPESFMLHQGNGRK